MSEDGNFVARWSRLKRQTGNEKDGPGISGDPVQGAGKAESGKSAELGQPAEPEAAFDVSKLPPIESITANTDIRDFLQAGVPTELTKAALRRVWSADPAIRDFIGIAENQWDFTDPTTIPGFGPLQVGDNVQDLVAQAMGKLDFVAESEGPKAAAVAESTASAGQPPPRQDAALASYSPATDPVKARADIGDASETQSVAQECSAAAPQHEPTVVDLKRRRHGRALPSSY